MKKVYYIDKSGVKHYTDLGFAEAVRDIDGVRFGYEEYSEYDEFVQQLIDTAKKGA